MKLLFFFGTRPEAIKMATVLKAFQARSDIFRVKVCISSQHREMLDQVLRFFDITPDYDLDVMNANQSLFDITTGALEGLGKVLSSFQPEWLFVQGDTTTTFVGALAAFYEKVKVAHIEAGLRSFNKYSPFPEEMNRVLTSHLADLHFAPTRKACENLLGEGVPAKNVHVVGNTGIDALFLCMKLIEERDLDIGGLMKRIGRDKRVVLVTGHRRESFGRPLENICHAVKTIASEADVEIVYPVHLNPNVRKPVFRILGDMRNVHLIEPLEYPSFVWMMNRSHMILTDSGGVQEEAPSLGKPVLVMRDVTERVEGIDAGTAVLVGTDRARIVKETLRLFNDTNEYERMSKAVNPYGDGRAAERIVKVMESVKES